MMLAEPWELGPKPQCHISQWGRWGWFYGSFRRPGWLKWLKYQWLRELRVLRLDCRCWCESRASKAQQEKTGTQTTANGGDWAAPYSHKARQEGKSFKLCAPADMACNSPLVMKIDIFLLKVLLPAPNVTNLSEVPEAFRPTEWLSEVIPRKAPYYPQMGDEVMYFRQGHQLYLNAVRAKNVYEVGPRSEPWARQTIRVSYIMWDGTAILCLCSFWTPSVAN